MKEKVKGFSLVELIAVISLMALLLGLGMSMFRGSGESESRKASRSLILAGLTDAQSRALATGEPVAFVMTPFEQGREKELGRSFTLYAVRQDDISGEFTAEEQLRRWSMLPGQLIFAKGATATSGGQNAFEQSPIVSVQIRDEGSASRRTVEMPAIIFGAAGNVIWPAGEGELELQLTEGSVIAGQGMQREGSLSAWSEREVFIIGRQTGRARYLQTQ